MKKIAVSLGLVVVGASVVQAAPYSLLSMQSSKAWSVGASLRGFYDDNYTLASTDEQESLGFQISPTIGINLPMEQTLITADYIYSMYYYDAREDDEVDQTHQFLLNLSHSFSERFAVEFKDSFVVAQEPGLIDSNNSLANRANGNNIRNTGSVRFRADLTRKLGLVVGYSNTYYDYEQDDGTAADPSLSGLMDRMEHLANIDLRWLVARNTTAIIGYQFGAVAYTQNEDIGASLVGTNVVVNESTDRNNYSHFLYAGVERTWNQKLTTSLRLGVQVTDYYDDPSDPDEEVSPYVEGNIIYAYSADGSLTFGSRHSRNQTDVVSPEDGEITLDQESTVFFVNVNHQITPKLTASLLGSVQISEFNGGSDDGESDTYLTVTPTLKYNFNQHFSADVSYIYTTLDSDIDGRDYDRGQVFLGVTAAY